MRAKLKKTLMSHNTGLADGLHRYLRISYGEMDDNNAATYMMQGSNYNDARKLQGGRIKMRSPPKVLTGNFRPSQLSSFLS